MRIWKTQLVVVMLLFSNVAISLAETNVLRFQGQLGRPDSSGQQVSLRNFDCVLVDSSSSTFFYVLDDFEGCPWPDAFGTAVNAAGGGVTAHLLYRFDGNAYTISLPDLKMELPADLNRDSSWTVGDWQWRVKDLSSANTVKLQATERRGRKKEATFDSTTGQLIDAKLDVFMGRGEQFQLQLKRTSIDTLSAPLWDRQQAIQETLLQLQAKMNRRPDSQRTDLSVRQVQLAEATLERLEDVPPDLPVRPLIDRIAQQVERQVKKMDAAETAKSTVLGKTLSLMSLTGLDGKPLSAAQISGKPLVLHFWTYSQKAMEEPYGQVAYLEFLQSQPTNQNVNVIGVITNPSIFVAERQATELRSARKVAEFMNLSYPIAYDDGSLQKQCDPSSAVQDNSPLWIVADATGKVVHCHHGFYEVDRRAGLRDLAAAIADVVKVSNQ